MGRHYRLGKASPDSSCINRTRRAAHIPILKLPPATLLCHLKLLTGPPRARTDSFLHLPHPIVTSVELTVATLLRAGELQHHPALDAPREMPPRASFTSSFSASDANNEVVCPLRNHDGSNCRKRCLGVSCSSRSTWSTPPVLSQSAH